MDQRRLDTRTIARKTTYVPRLVLGAVVVASLLPFLGKPFHIDDPMYLWAAQHIAGDPLHFYDFEVNWYGSFAPMYELNKNPPLVSFYLAAVGILLGWSEVALHVGMLLPAIALAFGVQALARQFGAHPLLAALTAWATPVVLVSATTLMSDVLMLSVWCWAATLWIDGVDRRSRGRLVAGAVLLGLCPLVKYFGLALLPLLVVATWGRSRRVSSWIGYLAIPIAIVGAYQLYMIGYHDWNPLADVAQYALTIEVKETYGPAERFLVGLSFLGGCLLTTLFFAPYLWSRAMLLAWGGLAVGAALGLRALDEIGPLALVIADAPRWDVILQMAIYVVAGLHLLALAARTLWQDRTVDVLVLVLWLGGVWFFASFTNWTTTARAVLPAAPAAAILLTRALARRPSAPGTGATAVALGAGLAISLTVASADYGLAASARAAAAHVVTHHGATGGTVYFQGAWGFQQYMETAGATRLDFDRVRLLPRDLVVTPANNTNLVTLPKWALHELETFELPAGLGARPRTSRPPLALRRTRDAAVQPYNSSRNCSLLWSYSSRLMNPPSSNSFKRCSRSSSDGSVSAPRTATATLLTARPVAKTSLAGSLS